MFDWIVSLQKPLVTRTVLAGLIVLIAFATPPARATEDASGPICGPRDTIVQQLSVGFREESHSFGTTTNGLIAELFVSKEGSWTMVVTRPDGVSCLMAAGSNWGASSVSKELPEHPQQS